MHHETRAAGWPMQTWYFVKLLLVSHQSGLTLSQLKLSELKDEAKRNTCTDQIIQWNPQLNKSQLPTTQIQPDKSGNFLLSFSACKSCNWKPQYPAELSSSPAVSFFFSFFSFFLAKCIGSCWRLWTAMTIGTSATKGSLISETPIWSAWYSLIASIEGSKVR